MTLPSNFDLPASAQEIADVIGRDQALLLIESLPRSYAGDSRYANARRFTVIMYVPTLARMGANHRLVQILGWHDAAKLCAAFGGEIMYPASCAGVHRRERDDSIRQMAAEGMRAADIGAAVGITERRVRSILAEIPPEDARPASRDNSSVHHRKAHAQ